MASRASPLPPIARASALQLAGHVASAAAALATLGVAARALGAGGFGRMTLFLAVFAILDGLVDFGTMGAAVRRAASNPPGTRGVVAAAVRARLSTAAAGVVATGAFATAAGESEPWAYALAASYLFGHALAPLAVPLHVEMRFGPIAAARVGGSLAALAFAGTLAALGATRPDLFLLAVGCGTVVSNALAAVAARWEAGRSSNVADPPAARGFLRESGALGLGTLFRQTYAHLDSFFLRPAGAEALARFNAPYRLLLAACALPGFACAAALPALSCAGKPERRGLENRLARSLAGLAFAGGTAALVFAQPILRFVYAEAGNDAAPAMRLLVPAGLFAFPGNVFATALIARGRAGVLLRISAAGLGLRALLDAFLVPRLAHRGAAIAAAATEGFVLAACAVARRADDRAG